MMTFKKNMLGFSLIELVIFIVIIGIIVSGVFLAFSTTLQKTSATNPQTIANELASARMDIILGWRRNNGFSAVSSDPCASGPPAVCAIASGITGYTVTVTINPYSVGADSNYKLIDVLVTGPQNARTNLKTIVAYYP